LFRLLRELEISGSVGIMSSIRHEVLAWPRYMLGQHGKKLSGVPLLERASFGAAANLPCALVI
jgi:hypothetical protein